MRGPDERAPTFVVIGVIVALLLGGFAFAVLRSPATGGPSGGFGDAVLPRQETAPTGIAVGAPMSQPAPFQANFAVRIPPPQTWPPTETPPPDVPIADLSVHTFPGEVSTLDTDSAALGDMGGVAVVDMTAYLSTVDSVRAVDLKTGGVTTLAGAPGQIGCSFGTGSSTVRFQGPAGDIVSDDGALFVANGCGVERIDLTSGATSQLLPWSGPLTVGPDHHLYLGATFDGQSVIARVNPADGSAKRYVDLPDGSAVLGLAADSQYLWATIDEGPELPAVLDRVTFSDGSVLRFAMQGFDVAGVGQLASAGDYLYAPDVGNHGVLCFTKRTGAWGLAVGGGAGSSDGMWNRASFGAIRGLASDGLSHIWVSDAGNHSLRRVGFSSAAGMSIGGG